LGPGSLVGGRGIPKDASDVEVVRGNVVKKKLSGPADQLLSIMEDPADPKFEEAVSGLLGKVLEPDEALLPQQLLRLRKLIDPSKPPAARAVALLAIAKQRNLDDVPLLIFALGDDDLQVVAAARDGLRYISRKFFVEWPAIPEVFPDAAARQKWDVERRKAIEQWKAWYLSIRPDYQFED
jgi:hypothetical protein